ncbi:MAG TPA: AAA family ATPase, partial [Bryobacteraceae bacterium]|nr:AAA family ATPase [Bryobacteraceae bacterium]
KLSSVWELDLEIEWLIEDMIPLTSVTLISAPSGTGKTWLVSAIAGAVAHGRPFLGRATKQCLVLSLDGENPAAVVQRNLTGLGIERTENLEVWGGWCEQRPPGPGDEALLAFAGEHRPLLIFDSLIHFHDGDEQSATETRKYMNLFRALAHAGATVIVLHHPGKDRSKQYRGSSDILASVDVAYTLEGTPREGKLFRLTLRCFKSRVEAGKNFGMQFHAGRGFEVVGTLPASDQPAAESVIPAIIARHSAGINGQLIAEQARAMGVRKHAVEAFLKTWPHWRPGKGREKLYLPRPAAAAEGADDPEREAA